MIDGWKHWILVGVAVLGGCATLPPGETPVDSAPVSENTAVAALVSQARADLDAGRRSNAAAALERALRIEPRNAALWRELAKVRLADGRYDQAEQLAAKSNSFAGSDRALRAANFRLIADARAARGDTAGAQSALDHARELAR
ncbi:MAG: tetratricopeptide repeat protein [Pseudomonadota bacterium]|nr:MAG: tetratricopeptide repeat protein [Pseudomonadota bacterium]